MKSWTVVVCLVVTQLAELGCGKRFDPAMVDPLMRRSSLDKNFMRFGRSSPSYEEKEEADESPPGEDSFLRSMRGRDNNFMRFGRARSDNFMRFGRGKQDSFMRFGRARNDNYMRFGRARDNNFMRFGRGKQDNFMRFGRGKNDNYLRFGRGKQDNFMRFGKGVNYGKQDSFMRLGRGKQDNFMRFGRDLITSDNLSSDIFPDPLSEDEGARITRGRLNNNMIRFGKKSEEDSLNDFPFEVQSLNPKQSLVRVVRGKQDNFMRFGKSDEGKSSQVDEYSEAKEVNDSQNNLSTLNDGGFERGGKSKDIDLIRLARHPVSSNNAFIRYGRSSQDENPPELIPQRLKRSLTYPVDSYISESHPVYLSVPANTLQDDLDEEFVTPVHQEDFSSRKKRSLGHTPTTPPDTDTDSVVDYISTKLRLRSSPPDYESPLLAAGLPNVIVGPEFSLLPDLDPPASMLKRARPGDKSFLRLG